MSIEVGSKVPGKVSGITNFGAFIDLGAGKTGLVHISEVSDGYVKDIHDVLKVGDAVTVKVMTVGDDGKIGLSIRRAVDKPVEERPARPAHHSNPREASANHRGNSGGRPAGGGHSNSNQRSPRKFQETKKDDFDSLLTSFLKDSEDRLTSLKRNTEGKRGGRGGRRN